MKKENDHMETHLPHKKILIKIIEKVCWILRQLIIEREINFIFTKKLHLSRTITANRKKD